MSARQFDLYAHEYTQLRMFISPNRRKSLVSRPGNT
jgi:hypothetical protein